ILSLYRDQNDAPTQSRGMVAYRYGPFGTIEKTTQILGMAIETRRTYDRLGRVTSIVDPDSGSQTLVYNGFGEPIYDQSSGTGVQTRFFDPLGRLTLVNN